MLLLPGTISAQPLEIQWVKEPGAWKTDLLAVLLIFAFAAAALLTFLR
jgi:hypothetical protein